MQLRGHSLGTRQPVEQRRPLGVHERLHRLEPRVEAGRDEILALADEQPELLALPPRRRACGRA